MFFFCSKLYKAKAPQKLIKMIIKMRGRAWEQMLWTGERQVASFKIFLLFLRKSYIYTINYDHMPHLLSLQLLPHAPLTTCPPSNFMSFFYNPVSPISEAHMCIALSHPLDHEKPASGHTLKIKRMISSSSSYNLPIALE